MKRFWLLAIALFAIASAPARAAETKAPFHQEKDVVFAQVHGAALVMDIFTPTGEANGLGIVDVASGAWFSDRGKIRDHMMAGIYKIFCAEGFTVFVPRPGSVSKYIGSEMVDHVKYSIRWTRHHAAEYKVDPERLGLIGASAGGHLACMAAVTADDGNAKDKDPIRRESSRVRATAVFFPPTDFLNWEDRDLAGVMAQLGRLFVPGGLTEGIGEDELREKAEAISPARLVTADAPPLLIFHGTADPLVPLQQSEIMIAAMKAKGVEAELRIKEGGAHPWIPMTAEIKQMAAWLTLHLAPGS